MERDEVLVAGKGFAESGESRLPRTWFVKLGLERCANLRDVAASAPTRPARLALDAVAAKEGLHLRRLADVSVPGDIEADRTVAVVIVVLEPLHFAGCANLEVMIHQVVSKLAARAAESIGETRRSRVEHHVRGAERRATAKNESSVELEHLLCFGVDHTNSDCAILFLVENHAVHDAVWAQRKIPCGRGSGKSRRKAREVAPR